MNETQFEGTPRVKSRAWICDLLKLSSKRLPSPQNCVTAIRLTSPPSLQCVSKVRKCTARWAKELGKTSISNLAHLIQMPSETSSVSRTHSSQSSVGGKTDLMAFVSSGLDSAPICENLQGKSYSTMCLAFTLELTMTFNLCIASVCCELASKLSNIKLHWNSIQLTLLRSCHWCPILYYARKIFTYIHSYIDISVSAISKQPLSLIFPWFLSYSPQFHIGSEQIIHTMLITMQSYLRKFLPTWVKCALFPSWKMKTNNFIMGTVCFLASFFSILGSPLIEEIKIKHFLLFLWLSLALAEFPYFPIIFFKHSFPWFFLQHPDLADTLYINKY